MSHSNGKITSPISLHNDVYEVLGIAPSGEMYDVAEACISNKVNKWSFKKPIRVSQFTEVTDEQIMQNHCGLALEELGLLRVMVDGYQDVSGNYSKEEVLDEVEECGYTKPNEYYRLTDFEGYNHKALPSDKDWIDYSFKKSELTAIENEDTSLDPNDIPTNDYTFTISKTLKQMFKFSVFLGGDNDYNYIGSGNADMLPLSYISGNNLIEGEGWRIAYAIHTPYDASGNSTNRWHLFIGRKVMDTASDNYQTMQGYYPPDMSSNTHAVKAILGCVNKGVKSFTMIPCLVKNARLSFDGSQSPNYKISQVILDSYSEIYAMPSGIKSVILSVTTSGGMPQIGNIIAVKTTDNNADNYTWLLGYVEVQVNPDGSTVYAMVVARKAAITGAFTANLKLRYKTTASGSSYVQIPSSGSGTATYDISSGATFSFKGVTYNGVVIATAVGLNFNEDDVEIFNVQ